MSKFYVIGKASPELLKKMHADPAADRGAVMKSMCDSLGVKAISYDPYVDKNKPDFERGVYFIGTQHEIFEKFDFPKGSVVIDPFRMINKDIKGVKVIRIGDNNDY